jgi:acyl carrier protein
MSLEASIRSLIACVLSISCEEVADDAGLDVTRNWDSLKQMEVILKLESYFSVSFSLEQVETLTTFDQIVAAVNSLSTRK